MAEEFKFDTQKVKPELGYLKGIRRAKESGKGFLSMLFEIASLQYGPGGLKPEEYFMYGLYDDERFTPEVKRTYQSGHSVTVATPWAEVARDKPTLTSYLRGLDLPVPETQAIVHPSRTFAGAAALRNEEQICQFLREGAKYPIFGKPFDSICSLGTANIKGYENTADAIILSDDKLVNVKDFVKLLDGLGEGYLFQTLMLPHASLVPLIGNRVSSVRMFVISDEDGCALLRASWKIPGDENGADNFWRPGNILAGIDVESGRVIKTLLRTEEGVAAVKTHPTTGADFTDLEFPHWDKMRNVVLQAAVNLPGCHFQGWDVALTDRGPVLVELEGDGGDPIMEQLCFESGLLQGRYKRVVDSVTKNAKQKQKESKRRRHAHAKQHISMLAMPTKSDAHEDTTSSKVAETAVNHVGAPVSVEKSSPDSSVSV